MIIICADNMEQITLETCIINYIEPEMSPPVTNTWY